MYYIIADIEWIQNQSYKQSPTQLSAVRVDSEWNIVDEISMRIRPMDESFHYWDHVAYTGGKVWDFLTGYSCYNAFQKFNEWVGLTPICWWYKDSADIYSLVNKIVLKKSESAPLIILSEYMRDFLEINGDFVKNPYKLARGRKISVPSVMHDSRNDVIAIVNLLKGIDFPQELLENPPVRRVRKVERNPADVMRYQYDLEHLILHKKECSLIPEGAQCMFFEDLKTSLRKRYKPCVCMIDEWRRAKRERLEDEIARTEYNYIYAEQGRIFHTRSCGLMRNAYHALGTIKYDTVIEKGLRPCKVCRPSREDQETVPPKTEKATPKKEVSQRILPIKKKISDARAEWLKEKSMMTREKVTAVVRLRQSQEERNSSLQHKEMSKQERSDLFVLTQPRWGFFAARGYQNFHTRKCPQLSGMSDIRGFDTYAHAKSAGYTPCKRCKPTAKQNVTLSIPFDNRVRKNETVSDLVLACEQCGYSYRVHENLFELETPAGKWRIHTDERPVTVEHINKAMDPRCKTYHQQHRIFLSMLDALHYIYKHDTKLTDESEVEHSLSYLRKGRKWNEA